MSFIKLDRCIIDWGWFTDGNMLKLWIYILAKTNYIDKLWKGENVQKGTLVTSIEHLAVDTGMSVQNVRTCLKRLEKTKEISLKSTNKYTQIIVNKWEEYQDDNEKTNKQLTSNQQTTNKQLTTTKEYKNIKNIKNIYNSNFTPPTLEEVKAYCLERNNGINAERFIDFYQSKGWKIGKEKMKDWKACVRTWEKRNEKSVEVDELPTYDPKANPTYDNERLKELLERRNANNN